MITLSRSCSIACAGLAVDAATLAAAAPACEVRPTLVSSRRNTPHSSASSGSVGAVVVFRPKKDNTRARKLSNRLVPGAAAAVTTDVPGAVTPELVVAIAEPGLALALLPADPLPRPGRGVPAAETALARTARPVTPMPSWPAMLTVGTEALVAAEPAYGGLEPMAAVLPRVAASADGDTVVPPLPVG